MSASKRGRTRGRTGTTVSLPVMPCPPEKARTIRPSRSGRRRAVVLGLVQLLMIAHIVQWLVTGRTLQPIEPSESVQTVRDGVINAGAIFFALALLSTLILGRWFCGWGCHIVMLQDLCLWLMRKVGIRPKPFRSRLLLYVPLAMALYMFVWPAVHRLGVRLLETAGVTTTTLPPWTASVQLTTTDFWHTFPGALVAIPFLLVCGFATVYFLGAKGYCTYGCPYGGFFAPIDRWAPGRIRVNDDCEQCGHCTAVCTSNVRVHEEVRAYGMVVDPGCMKCLDCVSVCPNDALSFGFGPSARRKGPPRGKAPKRVYDVTPRQDAALLAIMAATFFAVLGVYGAVPFLMASGVAGIVTWLIWKTWRLTRDENGSLHRMRLKSAGAWTWRGRVLAMAAGAAIVLTVHCGVIRARGYAAVRTDLAGHHARAMTLRHWQSSASRGGIGLLQDPSIDPHLEGLHLREARQRVDEGRADEAFALLEAASVAHPHWAAVGREYAFRLVDRERFAEARDVLQATLDVDPDHPAALFALAAVLVEEARDDEAYEHLARALELTPANPALHEAMGKLLQNLGRQPEASRHFETARRLRQARGG